MRLFRRYLSIILALTLPVQGDFRNGQEIFLGEATGYSNGSGKLAITSEEGVSCKGTFQYISRVAGTGRLSCMDGRVGNFIFTSEGRRGEGFGKTQDDEPFNFIFGYSGKPLVNPGH